MAAAAQRPPPALEERPCHEKAAFAVKIIEPGTRTFSEARALAVGGLVRQEQLRFLRDTARRLRDIGTRSADPARGELLRLAQEIEREAEDLAVVGLRSNDGAA